MLLSLGTMMGHGGGSSAGEVTSLVHWDDDIQDSVLAGSLWTKRNSMNIDTIQKKYGLRSIQGNSNSEWVFYNQGQGAAGTPLNMNGDFTAEIYVRFDSLANGNPRGIFHYSTSTAAGELFQLRTSSTDGTRLYCEIIDTGQTLAIDCTPSLTAATWHFIRLRKRGLYVEVECDGVVVGTGTASQAFSVATGNVFRIGTCRFNADQRSTFGWLDEFRFTTGGWVTGPVPTEAFPTP